jgi:hypothetical protein
VRASAVLALLDTGASLPQREFERQLEVALSADRCYRQVLERTSAGTRTTRAPWLAATEGEVL